MNVLKHSVSNIIEMVRLNKWRNITTYHYINGDMLYCWFRRLSAIFCYDVELHCCISTIPVNLRNFVNWYHSRCTVYSNVKGIADFCRRVENCSVKSTVFVWCLKKKQLFWRNTLSALNLSKWMGEQKRNDVNQNVLSCFDLGQVIIKYFKFRIFTIGLYRPSTDWTFCSTFNTFYHHTPTNIWH